MRILQRIIYFGVAILMLSACECKYDEQELLSQVIIVMELPDSDGDGVSDVCESVVPMQASFLTEYNTRDSYTFGTFRYTTQGELQSVVELRKGLYTLMLDATVYLPNGDVRMARCAEYAQPNTAVKILGDSEVLRLKMSYIY